MNEGIKAKIVFAKESMVGFKQELMAAKTENIDCEVNVEVNTGTRIEIVINGEPYTADLAELANDLIEKVVS